MSEASHSNVFVCQPQNRNVHGRVFGGFLMRWVAVGGGGTKRVSGRCYVFDGLLMRWVGGRRWEGGGGAMMA